MNSSEPSPVWKYLAKSVGGARATYCRRLASCRKSCSERRVHALRIQTRRLLALLSVIVECGASHPVGKLSRILTKRLKTFGPLRDVQVQLQLLEPLWPRHPEANGLRTLLQRRERKLKARLKQDVQEMKSAPLNRRLKKLERALRELKPNETGNRSLDRILYRAFERVEQLRRQIQPGDTAAVHRMRIEFKQFRYMSELLKDRVPITKERLRHFKDYQESAGKIQDLEMLLGRIARTIEQRKINPATVHGLRKTLRLRKDKAMTAFLQHSDLSRFRPCLEFQPH